jgi:hypothetical protein
LAKNHILHHIFHQAKVKYPNLDRILAIFSQKTKHCLVVQCNSAQYIQ